MNIFYVAFVRLPTEKAHGIQIMKTCEALADTGAEIELVVPGRKTSINEDPFAYYAVKENFRLTTLNTPDWVGWGVVGFVCSALWFSEAAKLTRSFWSADIIYSRDAFVLLQYLLLGRRLVYEAHTKPTWISKLVARHAYRIVVISEGLRDAYVKAGVPTEKITVAHDAIDPEPFKKHYDQKESRIWLGIPHDKKVALYVGRIDAAKGADTFAAASEHVLPDTLCVLIGSGPLKDVLQKKYPKALFLPETPYRELPRVLASADVLVLPNSAKDENAALYTSPLKAFAYLATGKRIVAADVPALRSIFGGNVRYSRPDEPAALGRIIESSWDKKFTLPIVPTWNDRVKSILSF